VSRATFSRSSVSVELAQSLISAAIAAAAAGGFRMSFAVVDESGQPKAFARMDGASFTSGYVAQDKAFTAASGRTTQAWHQALSSDAVLETGARHTIPRMTTLPGGIPIEIDGAVVGGLGVSGGHYSDDAAVAVAALKSVGARHEW
jgi:uncharacterized protein GlcG (DUF336 family)